MTDGIIQETFKKMLESLDLETTDYRDTIYLNKIDELQQELIEKIKQIPIEDYFQHYQPHHHSCNSKCNLNIITTLIGDAKRA